MRQLADPKPFASQTPWMGWTTNPRSPTLLCMQIPATMYCSRPRLMRRASNVSFAWTDEDSAAAVVERASASFSHYSYSASTAAPPSPAYSALPPPSAAGVPPATVTGSGTTAAQHHPHPPASPFRAFTGGATPMASGATTAVIPTSRRPSVARRSSDTTLLASAPVGVSLRGSSISPPGSYGNPPIRPPTPLSGSGGGGSSSLNGRRRAFGISSTRSIDEGADVLLLPVARSSSSFTQGTVVSPSTSTSSSFSHRLSFSRISDGDSGLVDRHSLQPSLRPTSKQLVDRPKVMCGGGWMWG